MRKNTYTANMRLMKDCVKKDLKKYFSLEGKCFQIAFIKASLRFKHRILQMYYLMELVCFIRNLKINLKNLYTITVNLNKVRNLDMEPVL